MSFLRAFVVYFHLVEQALNNHLGQIIERQTSYYEVVIINNPSRLVHVALKYSVFANYNPRSKKILNPR